jgi:hypothetical protein
MRFLPWLLVPLVVAGCNGQGIAPVSGRITLDGRPLANAVVLFEPNDDRHNPGMGSTGETDAYGRYELRQIQPDRAGALVGRHRVTIRTAVHGKEHNGQELIPRMYNIDSKLECDVPPSGRQDADFTLSSKTP